MLFSYNWLQSFFEKKLPGPKELEDLIIWHSFEVEGKKLVGNDTVFDVAMLSNRPDCFSHIGIAREIGAILGQKMIPAKLKTKKSKNPVGAKSLVSVEIKDSEACRRYTAMVVEGAKVCESPKWVKDRLESCGLRAINNIVDATNYVMLETGQPLHAFDWDKLQNRESKSKIKKIIVRLASKGENIEVLGEKKFTLTSETLLITDETGPLAIAGIKGGKRAEISGDTKTIVIEAANFNPRAIRKASRGIGLSTEASLRFEHGIDPNETEAAARRVAELIVQTGGGQVLDGLVDRYPRKVLLKKINLDLNRAESLLGEDVQTAKVKKILELLGFSVRRGSASIIEVIAPTRRVDVSAAEDLIEEIGRITGYDKIIAQLPNAAIIPPAENYFWMWKNAIKDAMAAAGWTETRNYSFISQDTCAIFKCDRSTVIGVKNPVNEDLCLMRPSLLPNLIANLSQSRGQDVWRQFEVGKIFRKDKKNEPTIAAGVDKNGSFYDVKGTIEFICRKLGVANINCVPFDETDKEIGQRMLNNHRSGKIVANKKIVGFAGQLSSVICDKLGISPAMVFELDVDALAAMATLEIKFAPLSIYPEAVRDISVDMPARTLSKDVIDVIRSADDKKLIKSSEIPDKPYIFGENKNILFKFHLHSNLKTLDSGQIDEWQEKTIAAIEANPGWKVKK